MIKFSIIEATCAQVQVPVSDVFVEGILIEVIFFLNFQYLSGNRMNIHFIYS